MERTGRRPNLPMVGKILSGSGRIRTTGSVFGVGYFLRSQIDFETSMARPFAIALGHKSIASTAVYAVPTDEMVGKAVNSALASLF